MPVQEVKAPNRVSQEADAMYGGAGTVYHYADMFRPVQFGCEEDTEILK